MLRGTTSRELVDKSTSMDFISRALGISISNRGRAKIRLERAREA